MIRINSSARSLAMLLGIVTAAVISFAAIHTARAQQAYGSPAEAFAALISAAKANDQKAMLTVLGPNGTDIVSSGDPVLDASQRELVVAAYDERHAIETEGDKAILHLGQIEYPFAIPVVRKDGAWRFDTVAGREEVLYRRVGRNELAVMQVCLAYVDAQDDYAEMSLAATGLATYAQRIVSSPGKKDGLYWPAKDGEAQSPLGEFAAQASAVGYRTEGGPAPFFGYYFKILTRQGPDANGGAYDYIARGQMIGGFALVAFPAEYGNSGVMTFIVNQDGIIYEKDLGPSTAQIARQMTTFNPDKTWAKAEMGEP